MRPEIIVVLAIITDLILGERISKRVIKGDDAPEDKYRWAISLKGDIPKEESIYVCGASLISKRWLLTAAHCFYAVDGSTILNLTDPSVWHIRAGARRLKTEYSTNEDKIKKEGWHEEVEDNGDSLEDILNKMDNSDISSLKRNTKKDGTGHIHLHADRIWLHPNYRGDEIEWDIALMRLKTPIDEKYIDKSVEIIELPKAEDSKTWPKVGQKCFMVGWGCKSHQGGVAEYGQLATLAVVTNKYCERLYEQQANLNKDHEFCAGSHNSGHGVCEGDSGSGLACEKQSKWVLAGVASATHGENPANFPGLFTRVSYFVPWINKVIGKD